MIHLYSINQLNDSLIQLRVASSTSNLALKLVEEVFAIFPELNYELVPIQSLGDKNKHVSFIKNRVSDYFTRELDIALLSNEADIVVHSAKDLPYPLPNGLEVIALFESFDKTDGTHPLQGHLALVAKIGNHKAKELFTNKDIRHNYGKVWLVGFGPGDPGLLTIKGLELIQTADIIYYDDLINQEFLAKFNVEKIYVGKRKGKHSFEQTDINQLLYKSAISGKMVVRLKGGDPMIFAHGGEEIEYLRRNLIQVSVVPGITAALAAAAFTGIPLTHRGLASRVTFTTGHSKNNLDVPTSGTLVYYMSGSNLPTIAIEAIRKGWQPNTPVLLVYNVSNKDQEEQYTTLQQVIDYPKIYKTPIIIIIGDVVKLKTQTFETIEKPKHPYSLL